MKSLLRPFLVAAALLLLAVTPAPAQQAVTVIGPVTPGHCPSWFSTTQLQDSGAGCGSGTGGVSSVGLALPASTFTVTGSPVVSSGTLTGTFTTQTANTVFAGPTTGSPATPTWRGLVSADLTTALTTPPPIGGTTAAAGAFTTLSASSTLTTNITGSTQCVTANSAGVLSGTGSACGAGGGGVTSVSNADGTLTISPTTGAVVASLALGHANTWTAAQTFNSGDLVLAGSTSGTLTVKPAATAGSNTLTLPAGTTDFSATGGASQVVKQTSAGGAFTVAQLACSDLSNGAAGCSASAANPTGTVGLSTVNGAATTFMRSDAAPPLSQAIVPTWTGQHTWTIATTVATAAGASLDDVHVAAATTTFTGTTTVTEIGKTTLDQPTFTDASAATITDAGTLRIKNAPAASGSLTITNPWALIVDAGATKLQAATIAGNLTTNLTSAGTQCVQASASGVLSGTGAACGTGSGAVNSVTNSDGTLTISPTTGAVVASLALGHANTWSGAQTFNNGDLIMAGATSGTTTLEATAVAGATIATFPSNTGTVAELNLAQTWTAAQTFNANDLITAGSTSGTLTLVCVATCGARTATFPANSGTVAELNLAQTWTAAQSFTASDLIMLGSTSGQTTLQANATAGATTATFPANTGIVAELNLAQTWSNPQTFNASDLLVAGSTSGTVTINCVATCGAVTATLPSNTGTIAELNLAQTWSAIQTFTNSDIVLLGSSTGGTTFTSANAGASNFTATVPANTGTIAELNLAQTWTAVQTFTNSDLVLLGSSTGATTFTSANAGVSNFTATVPANTGTIAETNLTQTWTNPQTFNNNDLLLAGSTSGTTTLVATATASGTATFPANTGTVAETNLAQTFSATQTFSGALTFSGLTTGTQVSCLGLTAANAVALSTGACGTGGGTPSYALLAAGTYGAM